MSYDIKIELLSRRGQNGTRAYFAVTPYVQFRWGAPVLLPAKGRSAGPTTLLGTAVHERAICICWLFWSIRTTLTTTR